MARRRQLCTGLLWPAAITIAIAAGAVAGIGAGGIEEARCEMVAPGLYRLDYRVSADTGAVEVWASSQPDRIDSDKPLLLVGRPPAEVTVAEGLGRVYFHLKPKSGLVRVVSIRRLPLEGARNFRDLGGYRTSDGRYVRWGLVYRSGDLANLTERDYKYLDGLGIRLVCDVRTGSERTQSPTRWAGRLPVVMTVPVGQDSDVALRQKALREQLLSPGGPAGSNSGPRYDRYVVDFAGQYGSIIRRLADGDLPAVEHCSSGKDRTGIFSAILLTALGVPRDVVIEDYLLTNPYLLGSDSIEETAVDLQRTLGLSEPPDQTRVRSIMTSKAETLESAFATIDRVYRSFDNYLRDALKVSDSDVMRLRERLLEP